MRRGCDGRRLDRDGCKAGYLELEDITGYRKHDQKVGETMPAIVTPPQTEIGQLDGALSCREAMEGRFHELVAAKKAFSRAL